MAFQENIQDPSAENLNSIGGGLAFETGNNRILGRDENSTPRLVIRADGQNFEMKVSQPGEDVLSAPDNKLIFNSNQNIFKIVKTGNAVIPAPGAGTYTSSTEFVDTGVESTEALMVMAYQTDGTYSEPLPSIVTIANFSSGNGAVMWKHDYRVHIGDNGHVIIRFDCQNYDAISGPPDSPVKWFVLQESAL